MRKCDLILLLTISLYCFGDRSEVGAQTGKTESANSDKKQMSDENFNLSLKTIGGKQFWTDFRHFHEYRIQKNVMTGHFRLLDGADVRRAWGTWEQCQRKLDTIAKDKQLRPMSGKVVIVIHGLTRTRRTMRSISKFIEDNSDLQVLNISYASTRDSIAEHAKALHSIVGLLPEVEEISFLGHSMGNIVVRYYLGQRPNKEEKSRFGRMVMLGPPNHGSGFAKYLQDNYLFQTIWGASGQDLSRDWDKVSKRLAVPDFEFGIIAGGQQGSIINNTLLKGDDDFVVSVEETKLAGASDFVVMPLWHSTMMNDQAVHKASLRFLLNGYFDSEKNKQPIHDPKSTKDANNGSGKSPCTPTKSPTVDRD